MLVVSVLSIDYDLGDTDLGPAILEVLRSGFGLDGVTTRLPAREVREEARGRTTLVGGGIIGPGPVVRDCGDGVGRGGKSQQGSRKVLNHSN